MYNKNNIDSYFLFVEANQNAGRARKTTLIVEPCCIKEECCFQLGRSTETVCVCWEIEAISNPRYFFRLAHVNWLSRFLLKSQQRRVPSGERCAFAIPNPLLLLMLCDSQTNYCSICASPARPLQAVLKAPRSPASAIHRTQQSTTDSHTSLAQTKQVWPERKDMRQKGSIGRLRDSLQRRRPFKLQKNSFLLIDESPGHDGIQMWQFRDIKGANSSASPAAVQLGTKWSLSHCILLRCSLWFRICSIIFSSWAKADRRVGRCVLSIPFTSPTGGLESEGGID